MELVSYYISLLREETENQVSYDSDGEIVEGISTNLILSWINRGQQDLVRALLMGTTSSFVVSKMITLNGAEDYEIDNRMAGNSKIIRVRYRTGTSDSYFKVFPIEDAASTPDVSNYTRPLGYAIRNRRIRVIPALTSGDLEVLYRRWPDGVDLRRGLITGVTKNGAETHVTHIVLADDSNLDPTTLVTRGTVTAVSATGAIKGYDLAYSNYNATSRTLTLTPEWEIGSVVPEIGDYVVGGAACNSFFSVNDDIRDYAIQYAKTKILSKDGDLSLEREIATLNDMFQSISLDSQEESEEARFLDEESEGYSFY